MDCHSNIFGRNGEGYIRDEDFPSPFDNIENYLLPPDTFLGGNDDTLMPSNFNTIHVNNMLQSEVTVNDNDGTLPSRSNPTRLAPNLHDHPSTVSKSSTKNRILLPDGLEIGPYGLTIINSMSFSEPRDEIKNSSLDPSNSILSKIKETQIPFSSNVVESSSNVANFPYEFVFGSDSSFQNVSSSMKIITQSGASRDHIPLKLLLTPKSSCSISNCGMPTLWNQQWPSTPQSSISMRPQQGMHAKWRPLTSQPFNLVDQQQVVKSKRIMTPEMLQELEKKDSKRYKI